MVTPSIDKPVRSRLLPKLTLGRSLLLVTLFVLLAWLGRTALQGSMIARVILLGLSTLLLFELLSVLLFFVAWLPAVIVSRDSTDTRDGNPFADDQLPPQILPPTRNT